uniref:Uncharacterized protein n=1 Tax=Octopus bimaculoides TaxID=37653 RepID=A0A0L8HYS6_OCTBM
MYDILRHKNEAVEPNRELSNYGTSIKLFLQYPHKKMISLIKKKLSKSRFS